MKHLSEEELILHYYSEEAGDAVIAETHLDDCEECRLLYGSLQRVLNVVDSLPLPQRGPEYGTQVWNRIEQRLPVRRRSLWALPAPWRWAAASAAFASLLVAAFLAGRFYPRQPGNPHQMAGASSVSGDSQTGERVLMVAVGDYLERSQMVLVELANANPKASLDISSERERAADLVSESRLYRQTAAHTGDTAVASVLDDLDRVLMEISHAPSQISPEELENLRQRFEAEGILFKIRVLGSNVRNHETAPAGNNPSTARQKL
jgi:anti-sigma-K factor RskA